MNVHKFVSVYEYVSDAECVLVPVRVCVSVLAWECLSAVVTHGIWATIVAC